MDASFAYRRTDGHSAGPVRRVIMLYEQLIKDLQRALAAMERKDIAARTNELDHALRVVGHLQTTLNLEQGSEVARNLDRYYYALRASLLQAQIRVSPEMLRKQIASVLELREAWVQVERTPEPGAPPPLPGAPGTPLPAGEKSTGWSI
jgi:flagellar protein FliS